MSKLTSLFLDLLGMIEDPYVQRERDRETRGSQTLSQTVPQGPPGGEGLDSCKDCECSCKDSENVGRLEGSQNHLRSKQIRIEEINSDKNSAT